MLAASQPESLHSGISGLDKYFQKHPERIDRKKTQTYIKKHATPETYK